MEVCELFEDSPAGMLLVAPDGLVMRSNQAFRDLVGYESGELAELSVLQLIHPEDRAAVRAVYRDLIQGKPRKVRLEKRYLHKDGHLVWAEITSSVVRDPDGSPRYVQTIAQDSTEKVNAVARSRTLQQENARISESIASLSHEFRTPLNAVLGFAQLLLDDSRQPLTERQRHSIEQIELEGNHLLQLINDVLDLARVKSGRIELAIEQVDVGMAMGDAACRLRPLALQQGVELRVIAGSRVQVSADSRRLHQILLNLMANAIKFTPAGGSVVLTAAPDGDHQVAISVSDTGSGIAPDQLDEIFDEYRQARSERGRPGDGTGLGLALSRRLATVMDGSLTVESQLGKGSVFRLSLPASPRFD